MSKDIVSVMTDYLNDAREELKRADHLIYVSLKYTRTCDVIKSVIVRFINCMDIVISGILEDLVERGVILDVPTVAGLKVDLVRQNFSSSKVDEFLNLYLFFRKVNAAEYSSSNEFRRHVTLTVVLNEEVFNIKIETVTEYYDKLKEFVAYFAEFLKK